MVLFIPCAQSPLKKEVPLTDGEHRYRMLELAASSNPFFHLSRLELERGGVSYTVDTLRELHILHPESELFLIMGLDAVLELPSWKEPEAILELCFILTAVRPGADPADLEKRLPPSYRQRLHLLEMVPLPISSSEIRRRLARGGSIRYWTPDSVIEYIQAHRLYGVEEQS